jgi:cytochrome c553
MFKKSILSIALIAAILLVAAGLLIQTKPAQASAEKLAASDTSSCLSCHENRYFQHDTGNLYCLTEAAARCVDCHAGNPEAFEEKAAHAGLVAYPILNGDISRCENCHEQDAQAHVDTFAALAGYSQNVFVAEQVQPSVVVAQAEETSRVTLDAKTLTGISVILTVIAGMFVFCFLTNKSCH